MLLVDELGDRLREQVALALVREGARVGLRDGVGVPGGLALGEDDATGASLGVGAVGEGVDREEQDVALAEVERRRGSDNG